MMYVLIIGLLGYYLLLKRQPTRDYNVSPIVYYGQQKQQRIQNTMFYADTILQIANKYKIDPAAIASIIATESEGIACAYNQQSYDTYIGLMQIGYKTAQGVGYMGIPYSKLECPPATGLFIPSVNVEYGTKYFQSLYLKYKSLPSAVSAYQLGSAKFNNNGDFVNMGYIKTVLDFVPNFRDAFRAKQLGYDVLYPDARWNFTVA
jgi:soluble lytic murein transglycosylase-like protein